MPGDYSMGTASERPSRDGRELRLLSSWVFDATTFGNHDFDLGPDGTPRPSRWPPKPGAFGGVGCFEYRTLPGMTRLCRAEATGQEWRSSPLTSCWSAAAFALVCSGCSARKRQFYTRGAGAIKFQDPIEDRPGDGEGSAARPRRWVSSSHSAMAAWKRAGWPLHGREDVRCDGRSGPSTGHWIPQPYRLQEAVIVNGRTPVVQTGKYGENLGELVITLTATN